MEEEASNGAANALATIDHRDMAEASSASTATLRGLNLRWTPNFELPIASKTKQATSSNLLQAIESNLVDGLLVPPTNPRKLSKLSKQKIPDTTGVKWFNMPAKTLTPELKRDLQLLKLRSALDPKRHYKREKKSKELSKYFQVGTVVAGPAEFYSSRLTRKQQKTSFTEELLADSKINEYRRRKFAEIQQNHTGKSSSRKKGKKAKGE